MYLQTMQMAIITGSYAPLRAEKSGASEMVSQLSFGEVVEILDIQDTWVKVRNLFDQYIGWMDIRLLSQVSTKDYTQGKFVQVMILPVFRQDIYGLQVQVLGIGAFFPDTCLVDSNEGILRYEIGKTEFQISEDSIASPKDFTRDNIVDTAQAFLNLPYVWGGRSFSGMDCSGLVQTVFRLCSRDLPRDAKDQVLRGKIINFNDAKPGDLAFFSGSDTNITHTGIYIGEGEIIHASGYVKTDTLKSTGIYDQLLQRNTHILHSINTYFTDC